MNNQQAHNLSSAFWIASQRCMEARPSSAGHIEFPVVPGIVNAAFSIELGLKAIVRSEKGEDTVIGGHRLANLFKSISAETQDLLIAESGFTREVFQTSLESISNAFADWRYVFEKTELHIHFDFLTALGAATQVASARVQAG